MKEEKDIDSREMGSTQEGPKNFYSVLQHFICVQFFLTPWTVAQQAPLSMRFSSQEYWSGLPFPFPGELPYPGIEPRSPALQADSLPTGTSGKPLINSV